MFYFLIVPNRVFNARLVTPTRLTNLGRFSASRRENDLFLKISEVAPYEIARNSYEIKCSYGGGWRSKHLTIVISNRQASLRELICRSFGSWFRVRSHSLIVVYWIFDFLLHWCCLCFQSFHKNGSLFFRCSIKATYFFIKKKRWLNRLSFYKFVWCDTYEKIACSTLTSMLSSSSPCPSTVH